MADMMAYMEGPRVDAQHTAESDAYPRLVGGRWVASPLDHLARYEAQAREVGETYVAVPRDLLLRVSRFRECSARETFSHDQDGPMPPMEAVCRRERGHDAPGLPDHVREHSNGYYTWGATRVTPPGVGE